MKVSVITVGCKVNQSESDSIIDQLIERGYNVVDKREPADIVIINSCAVTAHAEAKSRGAVAFARRVSPNAKILVTGCYSQKDPTDVKKIKGVQFVLGNVEKSEIVKILGNINGGKSKVLVSREPDRSDFINSENVHKKFRTRAFLKIQDGCSFNCSYCIVPKLRGISKSRPIDDCVEEAKKMAEAGYKEIVLTGINIGSYRYGKSKLVDLIKRIAEIDSIGRIRLSSIEPNLIDDALIDLVKGNNRVCPHIHIPLQHASDKILASMNRKYSIKNYDKVFNKIYTTIENVCIGTDVIVGFPGETVSDFEYLYSYLKERPFGYIHVFSYSKREGTPAANYDRHIEINEIKRRSEKIQILSKEKKYKFMKDQIGKTLTVLFEKCLNNRYYGYSENYMQVSVISETDITNKLIPIKVTDMEDITLIG